jgi:hypothetical protein
LFDLINGFLANDPSNVTVNLRHPSPLAHPWAGIPESSAATESTATWCVTN